jgi:hypothetical protein
MNRTHALLTSASRPNRLAIVTHVSCGNMYIRSEHIFYFLLHLCSPFPVLYDAAWLHGMIYYSVQYCTYA